MKLIFFFRWDFLKMSGFFVCGLAGKFVAFLVDLEDWEFFEEPEEGAKSSET